MAVANVNYKIDDELHRRAKAEAAYHGVTLREYVVQAIQQSVERDEAERKKRSGKRPT
jgi:predicted HicB family RNase H-like nuclease